MHKMFTNEEFLQDLKDNNILFVPLEEYKGANVKIEWRCHMNKNHIFNMKPSHIKDGHGCPFCSHHKVFIGETDMWTTNPDLASMLHNPDDGYRYFENSHQKVDWDCPCCGLVIKNKIIKNVNKQGLLCENCSDNISYSEKFMLELLSQLGVDDVIFNKTTPWSNSKRYDFYIPSCSLIIETNGIQHYKDGVFDFTGNNRQRSLEDEIKNDDFKLNLALQNGIKNYVSLDCRESNLEFVKSSILNSDINILFDLSNVNWEKCHFATSSSTIKDICDLYNSGMKSPKDIADYTKMNYISVLKKLNAGKALGICDYVKNYNNKPARKRTLCVETGIVYQMLSDVENDGYCPAHVSRCCRGERETAYGKHWKYLD